MHSAKLETSRISPLVIHCHMFPEDFGFTMEHFPKLSVRKTYDYELELIISDGGIMMLDNKTYSMKRGIVFFRRPGEYTNGRDPFHACSVIIKMTPELAETGQVYGADYYTMHKKPQENYDNDFLNAIQPCTYTDNIDRMVYLFNRIQEEFCEQNAATPLLLRAYTLEILYLLYKQAVSRNKKDGAGFHKYHKAVHKAIVYINTNIAEPIKVQNLAQTVGLNPDYFSRVFTECTGQTPNHYILELRLSKARDLLIYTTLQINEIAYQCGFQHQSYFTLKFRERYGVAPTYFRKQFD